MDKTNVMRILDNLNIKYNYYNYDNSETRGEEVAKLVGKDANMVFKTLVTIGSDNKHYVFMIPVNCELDLKKAALCANVKRIEMIKQKELFPLTGYIHGGCSPIGMKKDFPTFIDEVALLFDEICFSGGKVGYQVEVGIEDLKKLFGDCFSDLTK